MLYAVFYIKGNWSYLKQLHAYSGCSGKGWSNGTRQGCVRLVRPLEKSLDQTIIGPTKILKIKILTANGKRFGPTMVGVVGLLPPTMREYCNLWGEQPWKPIYANIFLKLLKSNSPGGYVNIFSTLIVN